MMKKTEELTGLALDYAVAMCEFPRLDTVGAQCAGEEVFRKGDALYIEGGFLDRHDIYYSPSTVWRQGGPIIELVKIELREFTGVWSARLSRMQHKVGQNVLSYHSCTADTPLVAAMRCYVSSALGAEIEFPEGFD